MTVAPRMWIAAVVVIVVAIVSASVVFHAPWRTPTARPTSAEAIRSELFHEIQPVQVSNCELRRFGEQHDGGYPLCANLLSRVQAGYSYGISGYDGWGCEVSRRLHIPVHQYDCFDLSQPSCPDGQTVFHGECIGTARNEQDGRPFDTLSSQFARNGHASTPVVMKIDVEGAEWDAFLLAPESTLSQIDQLDVEFHNVNEWKYVETMRRLKQFFYVAHVHYNNASCDRSLAPFPAWAFEVLLVNKRIATSDGTPAVPAMRVDSPNNPDAPDCQATRGATEPVGIIHGVRIS